MSVKKDSGQNGQLTTDRADQTAYGARIRALIEEDRVAQARALVSQALEANPCDTELLSLRDVLQPPRSKPRRVTDRNRTAEFEWIVANRDAYRGRWVALQGAELVADAHSFKELQGQLKRVKGAPLIHQIE